MLEVGGGSLRWCERLIGDWYGDGRQMGTGFLFGNGRVLGVLWALVGSGVDLAVMQ